MQYKHSVYLEFLKYKLVDFFDSCSCQCEFLNFFQKFGIEVISFKGVLKVKGVYQIVKIETNVGSYEFNLNKCLEAQSYIVDNF